MGKLCVFVVVLSLVFRGGIGARPAKDSQATQDGTEEWGYVEVRPKAHMFWWLYKSPHRVENPTKPWPIILWLQGGPGGSGVVQGNFEEIGPLDTNLKPRKYTWLRKADLLFVENPVGTGYSYVEDKNLLVKNDFEAASDLTTFLEALFNRNLNLQKSPLYIVGQSYGGRFAVTLGVSAIKAIEAGKLKLKLGGVVLGDSSISPEDHILSYGPLLKDISRLDKHGMELTNSVAQKVKQQITDGQYAAAKVSSNELTELITNQTNHVNFYNFMQDQEDETSHKSFTKELMNGAIRKKLNIIPQNLTWERFSLPVWEMFSDDYLRPRINEVDELLAKGVNVTVYNGQLDLICSTAGTEAWVEKLKWEGIKDFLNTERIPLGCGNDTVTRGYFKSYKNLNFFWLLKAGHSAPADEPCLALSMVGEITNSPAPDFF